MRSLKRCPWLLQRPQDAYASANFKKAIFAHPAVRLDVLASPLASRFPMSAVSFPPSIPSSKRRIDAAPFADAGSRIDVPPLMVSEAIFSLGEVRLPVSIIVMFQQ